MVHNTQDCKLFPAHLSTNKTLLSTAVTRVHKQLLNLPPKCAIRSNMNTALPQVGTRAALQVDNGKSYVHQNTQFKKKKEK